ncbi:BMP and activin membrane-bound inhibitor homolog [Patella vulgata]|uniref:BMP and activin membrane-bound inhibitor homolog n=1 Tax=Patella vulgata TaxID=6465 RepID=UPI00217FA21B|nr:BMP and activin membrane-bound inhibitor homolog [Patella vulgata]
MASSPWFILLLGTCLAVTEGEIRCYCNESGCISTGYMCKSSIGQCYTAVRVEGETTRATHGCSLPSHLELCSQGQQLVKSTDTKTQVPFIMCCQEDMCNYIENIDINIILSTKSNGSAQKGHTQNDGSGENHVVYSRNSDDKEPERDLWFKAAVIAVPIAGGFILVLLVLLAVRMLRTDSRRHSRLIQIRQDRSLKKAQLYVTDHFSDKSGKNCSLFADRHKQVTKTDSQGRIYRPINDTKKQLTPHASIVTWGKPCKNDLATIV